MKLLTKQCSSVFNAGLTSFFLERMFMFPFGVFCPEEFDVWISVVVIFGFVFFAKRMLDEEIVDDEQSNKKDEI